MCSSPSPPSPQVIEVPAPAPMQWPEDAFKAPEIRIPETSTPPPPPPPVYSAQAPILDPKRDEGPGRKAGRKKSTADKKGTKALRIDLNSPLVPGTSGSGIQIPSS